MRVNDFDLDFDYDMECSYEGKPFTGISVEYYPGGELRSELPYVDGQQQGLAKDWYPSGRLAGESQFKDNQLHGITREWFESGEKKAEMYYEFGILVSKKEWNVDGELRSSFELETTSPYRRFLKEARKQSSNLE